jgi:hypothetical protein
MNASIETHIKNILRDIKKNSNPSNPAMIYIIKATINQLIRDKMFNFTKDDGDKE